MKISRKKLKLDRLLSKKFYSVAKILFHVF